jgi:uncharacterized membrane protein YfcA
MTSQPLQNYNISKHINILLYHILCFVCRGFLISMQFYFNYTPMKTKDKTPTTISDFITGFLIGTIATLLGITGGEYTASYLKYHKVPLKQVAGTTALVGLIISTLGSLGFIYHGVMNAKITHNYASFVDVAALFEIGITSFIMAYFGNKFLAHLKTGFLTKIFAFIIFISGVVMVIV